jgi:hypothetical protein
MTVDFFVKDWKNISSKEREVFIRETDDGYMVCSAIKIQDGEYLGKFYLDLKPTHYPNMIMEETMEALKFKIDLQLIEKGLIKNFKKEKENAST